MLRWRKKKSTLFIARKKIFYEAIAKWGPCAAFWSVWRKTAWLTASKLDHKFSGWWQHLSAHPKGKDLNKLHFNILGSFIPAEITQKQRNTHTWKSNRPKGLGSSAVHGEDNSESEMKLSASAAGDTLCFAHVFALMEHNPLMDHTHLREKWIWELDLVEMFMELWT